MTDGFLIIYNNMLLSLLFNQNVSTLEFLNCKNTSANFRICTLKPCPITIFGTIDHVLLLTAHCSPLIAYVLASLARAPWFHAGQGTLNPAPAFLVSMEAARWLAGPGVATV